MKEIKDLTGMKFNRLTVNKIIGTHHKRKNFYLCKCDCGNEIIGYQYELLNNNTKSCGCFKREKLIEHNTIHGMTKTRFYIIWREIIKRTTNPKVFAYERYGGRGIKVCDSWKSFENFKKDTHESYLKHCDEFSEKETTIDRINNNGNYEPLNCKWSTNKEQSMNRSSNIKITIDGIEYTAIEIMNKYNLTYSSLTHRISRKCSIEDLIKPIRKGRK